jgi:hypothetical protein
MKFPGSQERYGAPVREKVEREIEDLLHRLGENGVIIDTTVASLIEQAMWRAWSFSPSRPKKQSPVPVALTDVPGPTSGPAVPGKSKRLKRYGLSWAMNEDEDDRL